MPDFGGAVTTINTLAGLSGSLAEVVGSTAFPANLLVQVSATAADGSVTTGAGIVIDAQRREITLHVAVAELKRRRKSWRAPKPYARRGALAKYSKSVSSASLGAVTDLETG